MPHGLLGCVQASDSVTGGASPSAAAKEGWDKPCPAGGVSQGQLWEQVVGSLGAQTVSPPSG